MSARRAHPLTDNGEVAPAALIVGRGIDNRIVPAEGIGDIPIGVPIVVPLVAIDEITELVVAVRLKFERDFEFAVFQLFHGGLNTRLFWEFREER